MSKKTKALLMWALVVPLTSVAVIWPMLAISARDAEVGYALPVVGLFALFVILVTAVIVGVVTSTFTHTLLGVFLGFPLAFGVWVVIGGVASSRSQSAIAAQRRDLEQLLPVVQSGNRQAMATALSNLQDTSIPVAVCALAGSNHGPYSFLIFEHSQLDRNTDYPFSTDTLLVLLAAVSSLDIPMAEKEAAFYSVLRTLPFRNDMQSFPKWAELWDQAHEPAGSRFIEITNPYDVRDDFCPWGDTERLAAEVVQYWGDPGIEMWLRTEHSFAPAQQRLILTKVESPELLKALLAAGVDINAPNPRAAKGGSLSDSLLASRAPLIYQSINASDSPEQVVALIGTMVKAGADKKTPSATGQSPCALFTETEAYLDSSSAHSDVSLSDRQSAFRAIKSLLCESDLGGARHMQSR